MTEKSIFLAVLMTFQKSALSSALSTLKYHHKWPKIEGKMKETLFNFAFDPFFGSYSIYKEKYRLLCKYR